MGNIMPDLKGMTSYNMCRPVKKDGKEYLVCVSCFPKAGNVSISTHTATNGEDNGDYKEIIFDQRFLEDLVNALRGAKAQMEL